MLLREVDDWSLEQGCFLDGGLLSREVLLLNVLVVWLERVEDGKGSGRILWE